MLAAVVSVAAFLLLFWLFDRLTEAPLDPRKGWIYRWIRGQQEREDVEAAQSEDLPTWQDVSLDSESADRSEDPNAST